MGAGGDRGRAEVRSESSGDGQPVQGRCREPLHQVGITGDLDQPVRRDPRGTAEGGGRGGKAGTARFDHGCRPRPGSSHRALLPGQEKHQIVLARHLVIHPRSQITRPARNIGRRQMKLLLSGRDSSVPGQRDVPGALQYGPGRRTRAARTSTPPPEPVDQPHLAQHRQTAPYPARSADSRTPRTPTRPPRPRRHRWTSRTTVPPPSHRRPGPTAGHIGQHGAVTATSAPRCPASSAASHEPELIPE